MIPAAVMQKWIEGAVAAQTRWTERLFSLKVEADISFEAGQFAKLALPLPRSLARFPAARRDLARPSGRAESNRP